MPLLADDSLAAKAGDALPLLIRKPEITDAIIAQSSAWPCDVNRITMTIKTSVPLIAEVGHTITVRGLRGQKNGMPVSMAGPQTGNITVANVEGVLNTQGAWNVESGVLIVRISQDTMAGKFYVFSIDLTNPSSAQDCAGKVTVEISTFCFNASTFRIANATTDSTLQGQGRCGNFNSSLLMPGNAPTAFGGYPEDLVNGRCPLKVVNPDLHIKYIKQSSQYPCTNNAIQIILASNVPLRKCTPSLTVTGLDGTMTNSSSSFDVSILQPQGGSIQGNWNNNGTIILNVASVISDASCMIFELTFNLKNQRTPRGAATVQLELNGKFGFRIQRSLLTTPSTSRAWYEALPGMAREQISWTNQGNGSDPLYVMVPAFTKFKMGQTNPWPGTENSLKVTLATNVPMTVECSMIVISNLIGACADSKRILSGRNASAFQDLAGMVGFGSWSSEKEPDWKKSWEPDMASLMLIPSADTTPEAEYIFSFNFTNPANGQNSPGIQTEALGIPIPKRDVEKDFSSILQSPCHDLSIVCRWSAGDAAPLYISEPTFLMKEISQTTPYPAFDNELFVTLLANIPLSPDTLITISNLGGAVRETGVPTNTNVCEFLCVFPCVLPRMCTDKLTARVL